MPITTQCCAICQHVQENNNKRVHLNCVEAPPSGHGLPVCGTSQGAGPPLESVRLGLLLLGQSRLTTPAPLHCLTLSSFCVTPPTQPAEVKMKRSLGTCLLLCSVLFELGMFEICTFKLDFITSRDLEFNT